MKKVICEAARFVFKHQLVWVLAVALLFTGISAGEAPAKKLPGKKHDVTIVRDDYGVPHIFSDTKEGLAYGCGYAMAQDRLWQADLFRRQAFGSLAEFGLASIEDDYETRKLGYSRPELLEIFDNWVPRQPKARLKEMMLAYVDGINQYISEAKLDPFNKMPVEYLLSGGLPLEDFSIEDSVAITVLMAWRFGGTGGNELRYASAWQALNAVHDEDTALEIFNDLYPQEDPGAEVTIPSRFKHKSKIWSGGMGPLPGNIGEIYRKTEKVKERRKELYEKLGLPTKFGSNAWMVHRKKSVSHNAMQVGGPQMGHSIPQIVLEVGLHGAGINAVGQMMPHSPVVLIGVSKDGAWTSTTGGSDLIDTYIEVLNPDDPIQYLFNGTWRDMEARVETICDVSGYCENRTIYRTVHGPIFHMDTDNHLAYTMKIPYYKSELSAEEGWMLFQQAENIWDFQEAVKAVEASHNFAWVDRHGNIGFWHAGAYPIKPQYGKDGRPIDNRFPLWGTGEEEWIGLTGFAEMPRSINPQQGFLANWNNKPIAGWPYSEADWGQGHRVKRIQDLLSAQHKFSFEDMNAINIDAGYNHIPAMNLLHYLVEAAEADSTLPHQVVGYLKAWDHHYNDHLSPGWPEAGATYDDPGLTIFDRWHAKIKPLVFGHVLPEGVSASDSLLIHVFNGPEAKLTLNYDYLSGRDRNAVIVTALKQALEELEKQMGSDVSSWLTPVRSVTFSRLGALPSPRMHYMNRGTYNHIAEMPGGKKNASNPPHAVSVIPPGQSGFVSMTNMANPPHVTDQLDLYENWTYKPMLFRYEDILDIAESTTCLDLP
jgi:penicillin G amidase